jgi:DNA-binding GntR family transcriptional regulator
MRLVVHKLADRFGISSTPVREALVELEAVGMVRFVHNRGAVVKPFGPTELREVFQIRRILESEATRTACGRIDAAALEDHRRETAVLAGLTRGDEASEREMATDRRLHRMIADACGSGRLYDEIERYDALVQAIREIVGNRRQAQQRAMAEHLAVIDALLAGDARMAADEMARHIDRTADDVEAVMFARRT